MCLGFITRRAAMLIRTGTGSLSLVAGCCWVNSVAQRPAPKREGKTHERQESRERPGDSVEPTDQPLGGSIR